MHSIAHNVFIWANTVYSSQLLSNWCESFWKTETHEFNFLPKEPEINTNYLVKGNSLSQDESM